jgi:hypothetical protein
MTAGQLEPEGADERLRELTQHVRARSALEATFAGSQYVTEAVARRLEMDLLADLSQSLTAEHGPIPEQLLAVAQAAWADAG